MASVSPSPNSSPLADPPTSTTASVPQPPTPTLTPPTEINANPPESSTILSPPPPVASPPPASSPPPLEASPPPVSSPPPVIATSPPPPVAITPPNLDAPPPPPTTTATPPPTSPPPPSIPPSSSVTSPPSVPPPPTDPPSSPPPPATKPKPPPPTSSPRTPLHSPPPSAVSQPPKSQPPPPPAKGESYPPPPSSSPVHRPTSAPPSPQSPKSSPASPSQDPSKASPLKNSTAPADSAQTPPSASLHAPTSQLLHPSLANPPSENATASSPGKGGVSVGEVAAISVTVAVVMLGLIGVVVWFMSKRKRTSQHNGGYVVPSPYGSSPRSDSNLIIKTALVGSGSSSGAHSPTNRGGLGHSQFWFTYQELFEATDGFAFNNLLGEGGFGTVYKGILTNGREVAVKQLKIGGSQGEREFKAEIETISRVHHRHLVSLVGYCIHESRRLLVYDFVANQTLHYHLHGENLPVMNWAARMKVALGAARGIAYLHEDCHPRIIHRDIKSSNILLDSKFEAQVSDFGLAKALDMDTHVSTRVMGTFGYVAPEYATSGKLTEKSDVYSFGVVLLELITGRKPVDESQPVGDESLVEWARPLLSNALDTGQTEGLVDPRLEKNYVESELFLMIEAAAACVRHSATKRPRMGQVVRAFDGLSPSDLSNGMRVGQSQIYDSAQQSAELRLFRRMAFGSQDCSTGFFEASRSYSAYSNRNQNDEGTSLSSQQRRNELSQQPSHNRNFSSPAFSEQRSQNPDSSSLSSHNPIHPQHHSQNHAFSRHSSQNFVFGTE